MFFLLAQPMYIYIYIFLGYTIWYTKMATKGFFFEKVHCKRGGISLAQKSHRWIFYLRQCTCLLDGKVVGQAAKGERFLGGKCDHAQTTQMEQTCSLPT